jgi:hypothetical protein
MYALCKIAAAALLLALPAHSLEIIPISAK